LIDAGNQLKLFSSALNELLLYFCQLVLVHRFTDLLFRSNLDHVFQVSAELSVFLFELDQLASALQSFTFDLALQVLLKVGHLLLQLLIQLSESEQTFLQLQLTLLFVITLFFDTFDLSFTLLV
jgi:hypothetical protein